MSRFDNKVILITGAGSGLGRATAVQVATEGAQLSLVDKDPEGLQETRAEIVAKVPHVDILLVTADVTSDSEVRGYVDQTVARYGKIDGFFNNAGIAGSWEITEAYEAEAFDNVIRVNLNGVFYGLKHVLKVMKQQGHGSVVNTASVSGIRGVGHRSGYAASKHGIVGLTRNSAVEYGAFGISVNAIAPGAILTAMVVKNLKGIAAGGDWEKVGREFVQANPMKRMGTPEEVASLAAFLLSGQAAYINGAVIPIDGGQSCKY